MIRMFTTLLFLSVFLYAGVDQLTLSPGSWIVKTKGSTAKPLLFHKLAGDAYVTLGRVKMVASLPLAFSVDSENEKTQLGIGDINIYAGIPFGIIEPRIGIITPGLYSTHNDKAWIGSQDLKLGVGLALKSRGTGSPGLQLSLETMNYFYVSKSFGFGEPGSVTVPTIAKGGYLFSSGSEVLVELLATFSAVEWEWSVAGTKTKELSLVPVLSLSRAFSSRLDLGLKAGAGPTWTDVNGTLSTQSTNISVGFFANISL